MAQNDMTSVGGLNCSSTPLICVEPDLFSPFRSILKFDVMLRHHQASP